VRYQLGPYGPLDFKAAGKPPVKGGRWSVRRVNFGPRPWRAWTRGRAHIFNRSFESHAEAVSYAVRIASMYADPTPENIRATLLKVRPNATEERIEALTARISRRSDTSGARSAGRPSRVS